MEIIKNYVNEDFEKEVLKLIPFLKKNNKLERNIVLRYGSKIPYNSNFTSEIIPDIFKTIKDIKFNSVTINEYHQGQKIDWHIDEPKGGNPIYIISLLSDGLLNFKKTNEKEKSFLLPRFSLAVMSDELRYKWQHSFMAESHRISVVLRNSN